MSPEELAAWGKASRAASGVPEKIEDPAVIARLVVLSDVGHDAQPTARPTAASTSTARARTRRKDPA